MAHSGAKYGNKTDYWKYSYTAIGLCGDYPFYTTPKLDTYGGIMPGYDLVSSKWHGGTEGYFDKSDDSAVAIALYAGGRYFFSPPI